jgi:t-SNARE complex subunit (syntaxin)
MKRSQSLQGLPSNHEADGNGFAVRKYGFEAFDVIVIVVIIVVVVVVFTLRGRF